MRENTIKKALRKGQAVIGTSISQIKGAVVPQIYAAAGLQFIYIDMQHSAYTIGDVLDLVIGARAAGIGNFVRVPCLDPPFIGRLLDSGIEGVMLPELETPDEVAKVVKAVKYPPEGERSIALKRMNVDFQKFDTLKMTQSSNDQTLIVIQIETKGAYDHVQEISEIKEIDALFIGPNDLAESLGYLGQKDHPEVVKAIEKVIEVCLKVGIAPGMTLPFDLRNANKWINKGLKLISYSNDIDLISKGASQGVKKIKDLLENVNQG